jgi:signal transduction histidine kinase/ActR/RegA family two-component response regulator
VNQGVRSFDFTRDERLDEVGLSSRKTIIARSILAVLAGGVAAINFGLPLGLGWTGLALACEAWTWLATNPMASGRVSRAQRAHYAVSLLVAVIVWSLLGLYAWASGQPLQDAAAVAIWTSQLLCAASFAFQTPRGFVLIAGPPTLAMFCAPFFSREDSTIAQGLTVAAIFVLVVAYAVAQARQTAKLRQDMDEALIKVTESEAKAEAMARAKSQFLANMSHEIRTPLTAIIGFADLLAQSRRMDPEDARRAGLIRDASGALMTVLNDVLDMSKMEAGALVLRPYAFDLAGLARDSVQVVTAEAEERRLWLWFDGPTEPVWILGDPNRLRQVLMNLLSNAMKFTRTGGVTVAMQLQESAADEVSIRVEVRDTGIGIPLDTQRRLFERFAQADQSIARQYGGSGLGLAICRELIERMGGHIGVQSAEGRGSTFWFELTLPNAAPASDERAWAETPAPSLRPVRLLVAEDHPVNRELLAALLEPFAAELDFVADGAKAVEAVQAKAYDLVLMDIQMPVMDGLEAIRRIRALSGDMARTPMVAMTANVLPDQVAEYKAAGANDFIGKPIDPGLLAKTIERYAAGSRPPQR